MDDSHVEQYQLQDKQPSGGSYHAMADDADNGFDDQPRYGEKYDPSADKRDMYRLGRKQELKRRFKYFSIAGYVVVLGNTWEFSVVTSTFSLANGGTAGAIWTSIFVCFGVFFGAVSLAEVASMLPVRLVSMPGYDFLLHNYFASLSYQVSEIAPRRFQKQLSYAVGWLAALGWQVGLASACYIFAQQLLALIALCEPGYVVQGWHGALMTIAGASSAIALSVFIMQRLTVAQGIGVFVHITGFIAFLAILWAMGPGANAHDVFFNFEDRNGWGNRGLATMIGMLGPVSTFVGGDSAVHLAEELQDASYILPRAMVSGTAINCIVGLIGLVSFMFNVGPIDDSLYVYGGQPWIAVIYRITGSKTATIVLVLVVAINFFCLVINTIMTSSRQVWAFARDKGLPFHRFLAKVEPDGLPRNAVVLTLVFTTLLALIIIGSASAFNIILSFSIAGVYTSYICILCCIIYRRFDGNEFPPTKFNLGRWGLPINLFSLGYLVTALVFIMFPAVPNPDPASMNWVSLMFGSVLIISFAWYMARARNEYDGPVEYVRKGV